MFERPLRFDHRSEPTIATYLVSLPPAEASCSPPTTAPAAAAPTQDLRANALGRLPLG